MAIFGLGKKRQKTVPEGFEVPSFPGAVLNLLSKLRDPDVSVKDLANELELDPGLHVRVLKTVNSAAFGLSQKVSNIQHAVNLMGRSRLESLVLSVAVKDGLTSNNRVPWLDMEKFWNTASRRATVARSLAAELHPQLQGDVFTIGLLQDIAVPVLANRDPDRYQEIYLPWLNGDSADLIEPETGCFSIDHPTLGAKMATDWEFPESLVSAIASHHRQGDEELPLSVKVAALIRGEADDDETLLRRAEQELQIEEEATLRLIAETLENCRQISSSLD